MRAFIVRPFGVKAGINFDRIEQELIDPVLSSLNISRIIGGDVFEAGILREDMLQQLLVSDLVIADITVQNANIFYELGLRHALREKNTFFIRAKSSAADAVPFDRAPIGTSNTTTKNPAHRRRP